MNTVDRRETRNNQDHTSNDEKVYLSVVIPAYNEERRIVKTLLDIDRYLSKQKYTYEILVVSDGSKDKTIKIVQNFQKVIKNLELIDNQANRGKGYVVRQGMLTARGKYRLFTDADNSTSIDHVEKMWPLMESGYDIVIGSRDSKDAKGAHQAVPQSFLKRSLGNIGNVLIQILAVWGIWDTQCGFKMFNAKSSQDVFSRLTIDRWGFDIEAMAVAQRLRYKIAKIPVYWINDISSKVSWKGYVKTFLELLQIKWRLMKNIYGF